MAFVETEKLLRHHMKDLLHLLLFGCSLLFRCGSLLCGLFGGRLLGRFGLFGSLGLLGSGGLFGFSSSLLFGSLCFLLSCGFLGGLLGDLLGLGLGYLFGLFFFVGLKPSGSSSALGLNQLLLFNQRLEGLAHKGAQFDNVHLEQDKISKIRKVQKKSVKIQIITL